jgi:hypothetical protein
MQKITGNQQKRSPGRPRKSENIKERTVSVYLPDKYMLNEWKKVAAEHEMSLSRFIIERVEGSLKENGDGDRYTRRDLIERNQQLERENGSLRKELELKTKVYEALDRELKEIRKNEWVAPSNQRLLKLSTDLVILFKTKKRILYDELLPALEIIPTDLDSVKAVNNQIDVLAAYGLVKQDLKGWRWIE